MEFLEELSLTTLQSVCTNLSLLSDGTKRQLVLRLKDVPKAELEKVINKVEAEDQCDVVQDLMQQQTLVEENVPLGRSAKNQKIQKSTNGKIVNVEKNLEINDNAETNDNVETTNKVTRQAKLPNNKHHDIMATMQSAGEIESGENVQLSSIHDRISKVNRNQNEMNYSDDRSTDLASAATLRDREFELLKRENALLKREQELWRKEKEILRSADCMAEQPTASGVSLNLVSNFVADYDGKTDGNFWVMQLRDIQQTYKLSDNMLRALFATKLVGRAQLWLHSRRNTADERLDELLQQFCMTFGTKQTKLELRRNFEQRKWHYEENFADYFNDKLMLASKLSMDEEELVEYIIDGISNLQIRTQAFMQQHTNTDEVFKALANVKLNKPSSVQQNQNKNKGNAEGKQTTAAATKIGVRCYNCNSVGHYAANCSKPRRQPGTCYACGSSEHMVADCKQNKKNLEQKNNYVRLFNFRSISDYNFKFTLECLIDSGSPISLIRRDVVPNNIKIFEFQDSSFYGLNYTKLKIHGKCFCFVEVFNKNIKFELIVVDEDSMTYSVLFGRDFLSRTNSKIVLGEPITDESVIARKKNMISKKILVK